MKRKLTTCTKTFGVLAFVLLFVMMSAFSVCAITVAEMWDNLNLYSPQEYIPNTSSIKCFDVNDNEQILVTLSDSGTLIVFDSNGNIEKLFKFNSVGDYSARFNDENNIELYPVRGGHYYEFTIDGEYRSYSECDYNQWQKESNFWESHTINYNTYSLEKAPLTLMEDCYARLVKTEGKGNETVFYDVTSAQIVRNILFILMLLLIFILAPLFFVFIILKSVRERRARYPAPPPKIIPVSTKQKVLKWSITALLLVKIAFTIVVFITTDIRHSYFSVISIFASCVVAAATVGTAGTIIFLCLAVLIAYCLVVGIVLLLSLKHKPTPALVLLSIVETADILYLFMYLFSPSLIIFNLLGLIFNLCIIAMIFMYRYITLKNRSKYLS